MVTQNSWNLSGPSTPSQRTGLAHFWLSLPVDQVEALWASGFGSVSKSLVSQLTPDFTFTQDQIQLRESIGSLLDQRGLEDPSAPQLMLATFLLSPPGLFVINNVDKFFPQWFVDSYNGLYKSPASVPPKSTAESTEFDLPTPDYGPNPSSLEEWSANRVHLNRLLGLSNLYYIDPDDKEVASELLDVRLSLAKAVNSCSESLLERLFSTDLGDRYWSLVRSGIQNEPLSNEDNVLKTDCVARLNPASGGGFGTPRSTNAFLVAMMYFSPGEMKVDNPENKIPSWLLHNYNSTFAAAIST